MALGAWSLAKALAGLNSAQPVTCCAAVYDLALGNGISGPGMALAPWAWVVGLMALGTAAIWGWMLWSRPGIVAGGLGAWPAVVIWAGLPAFFMVITRYTSPYVLELLYHPCPWCLLLIEHGAPGFILFGLPAWMAAESLVVLLAGHMARHNEALTPFACQRVRLAGLRLTVVTLVWVVIASLPGLWWFVRFGNWIR
jgi:hypothetical protein